MQISQPVLAVLSASSIGALSVTLPPGALDRKLYTDVDKVLRLMGGKWNKRTKAHEFIQEPPADAMDRAISTGAILDRKSEFGAFYTPPALAAEVIARANLATGMRVLEPSAGGGALARLAVEQDCIVDCVELDEKPARLLRESGRFHSVLEGNFLEAMRNQRYDRVVMNPPFARQADIDHVRHAYGFLAPRGRLVSIMSASVLFRDNRKTVEFRDFIYGHGGTLEPLPEDSFKVSGTSVNTCLMTVNAPR